MHEEAKCEDAEEGHRAIQGCAQWRSGGLRDGRGEENSGGKGRRAVAPYDARLAECQRGGGAAPSARSGKGRASVNSNDANARRGWNGRRATWVNGRDKEQCAKAAVALTGGARTRGVRGNASTPTRR
jgi:hypothetical protein